MVTHQDFKHCNSFIYVKVRVMEKEERQRDRSTVWVILNGPKGSGCSRLKPRVSSRSPTRVHVSKYLLGPSASPSALADSWISGAARIGTRVQAPKSPKVQSKCNLNKITSSLFSGVTKSETKVETQVSLSTRSQLPQYRSVSLKWIYNFTILLPNPVHLWLMHCQVEKEFKVVKRFPKTAENLNLHTTPGELG